MNVFAAFEIEQDQLLEKWFIQVVVLGNNVYVFRALGPAQIDIEQSFLILKVLLQVVIPEGIIVHLQDQFGLNIDYFERKFIDNRDYLVNLIGRF